MRLKRILVQYKGRFEAAQFFWGERGGDVGLQGLQYPCALCLICRHNAAYGCIAAQA
jgi:hypothetical protein